ncbi:MAG: hypothetical protein ACK56I_34180, partial [bacterium]
MFSREHLATLGLEVAAQVGLDLLRDLAGRGVAFLGEGARRALADGVEHLGDELVREPRDRAPPLALQRAGEHVLGLAEREHRLVREHLEEHGPEGEHVGLRVHLPRL